mmetsp:Transcript_79780/g.200760  ORF Transcript_79780/g.200760 Transcript_79780/m.200760 type:complete len:412 (-) Transcript_79780:2-1237(-)
MGGRGEDGAEGEEGECDASAGLLFSLAAIVLLFFLIMGLAGSVDIKTLKAQFHRRLGICCGLLCQFLLMPFISFVLVSLLRPQNHVGLTLLILCSSSGGAYSNWWCSLFNADLALSVAMTAVSTLCSAIMLPLNMTLYVGLLGGKGDDIEVPWAALMQGVGTVCTAIITGIAVSTKFPQLRGKMTMLGNVSGICMIALTAVVSVAPKRPKDRADGATPLWGKEAGFYAIVAAPFFVSLLASLLISSLRILQLARPERVAITIEVCYQNVGIASAVALAAFCDHPAHRSDAAAVPIIYGSIQAIALGGFCLIAWKAGWTYAPAKGGLFEILRGDFQPCLSDLPCAEAEVVPQELATESESNPCAEAPPSQESSKSSIACVNVSESTAGGSPKCQALEHTGSVVIGRPDPAST